MIASASITIRPVVVADLLAEGEQNFDLAGIDMLVNTHLHFDHCGEGRIDEDRQAEPFSF